MDTSDAGHEKPTVYIETSIVSYLTARPSRDLLVAAHQQLTAVWWDEQWTHYELFTSQVVVAEARAGAPDAAQRRLAVLERLPLLDVTDAAIALATLLVTAQALPAQAAQDALHLALACVHGMQYLLTWNLRIWPMRSYGTASNRFVVRRATSRRSFVPQKNSQVNACGTTPLSKKFTKFVRP
jgi:predicted nucleic acid-binding protein